MGTTTTTTAATTTAAGSRLIMSATKPPKQQVHTTSFSSSTSSKPAVGQTVTGTKRVYLFNEGKKEDKALLGGKGANLAEMSNIGLPVVRWVGLGGGRVGGGRGGGRVKEEKGKEGG